MATKKRFVVRCPGCGGDWPYFPFRLVAGRSDSDGAPRVVFFPEPPGREAVCPACELMTTKFPQLTRTNDRLGRRL